MPLSPAIVARLEERRRMAADAMLAAGLRPDEVARLVDLAFPPSPEGPAP